MFARKILVQCLLVGVVVIIGTLSHRAAQASAPGSWTVTGTMSIPRILHTETLLPDGRVLVTGGITSNGNPTETAEVYNPTLQKSMIPELVRGPLSTIWQMHAMVIKQDFYRTAMYLLPVARVKRAIVFTKWLRKFTIRNRTDGRMLLQ